MLVLIEFQSKLNRRHEIVLQSIEIHGKNVRLVRPGSGYTGPKSDPDPYILDPKFSRPESSKKLLDWTHYARLRICQNITLHQFKIQSFWMC